MQQANNKAAAGRGGVSFFDGMRGHGATRSVQRSQPVARMLRDTSSGVLSSRRVGLVDSRDDIRRVWMRSAALAQDIVQNSGRLTGAVDQTIGDTVGHELKLSPAPRLKELGYSDEEITEWKKLVKERWEAWSWNPQECDFRGKLTVPQMVDVALRYYFAFGEHLAIIDYFGPAQRRKYGLLSGTKVLLIPPVRLVQETNKGKNLFQGVIHDDNGRPTHYRIRNSDDSGTNDYPALMNGQRGVVHTFDPEGSDDVRGISKLAACFKTYVSHEKLSDTTLQQAIAQASVAMVLTSDLPSAEAFEAFQELGAETIGPDGKPVANSYGQLGDQLMAYLADAYASAKDAGGIRFGDGPMMPHLTPGEDFDFKTASVPGDNYIPFSQDLRREIASAIGVTYSSYSNDFTNATYSSVRMEIASIWPRVMRRRERIAAPLCQAIYEAWLDEEIGMGRIPLKGGIEAFRANRDAVVWAQWKGPAKPTADDYKSARAANERIQGGQSSREMECAENGVDADEVFAQSLPDHQRYSESGMQSPYAAKASQPASASDDPVDDKKPESAS